LNFIGKHSFPGEDSIFKVKPILPRYAANEKGTQAKTRQMLCTTAKNWYCVLAKLSIDMVARPQKKDYNKAINRVRPCALSAASTGSCAVDEGVPAVHGLHPAAAWTWVQARRLASRPEVKVVGFTPSFVRFVTGRAFLFVQTAHPVFLLQGGQLI
jgi:hypothetical protein